MSADNGIYILKCTDGYRVAHCQAIENIYWNCRRKDDPEFNARQLYLYFNKSKIYDIKSTALTQAGILYHEIINSNIPIIEYGIQEIGSGHYDFPTEEPPCCDNPNKVCIDGAEQCYNCGEYL